MKIITTVVISVLALAVAAFMLLAPASASSEYLAKHKMAFTETAFRHAQAENRLILIDVYAPWCPTCRRQHTVLNDYFAQNPNSDILVLQVDFDNQKDWVSYFKAPRQSTLALYRGEEQLWFSVAQTRESTIFAELKKHDQGAD
ncbi:thioredoxin family protein [Alkalimonas mucilaginosa]|uniref:Thioredoxin family protein n=1 Tax=Alkalimonas mucilaginosa TaxID=3057676 RepID=A0ABU7JEP4_9GAMM|nr:thioredoxin family protein [Alkalimonas sp. MEB004]MEE2024167.1 thioredoxin family protein [Alkalimonas sp. MEB004]